MLSRLTTNVNLNFFYFLTLAREMFLVGFEFLMAVSTKMAVFWVVVPCMYALMMEAARSV
jgi:hypothetical protein